jgi:hypothetical protein
MTTQVELSFVAYELHAGSGFELVPAPASRDSLGVPARFLNRCLPLLIANQAGWVVLNNASVRLRWDGGAAADAVTVEYGERPAQYRAASHFGQGIVTWSLPFLFRTPPGYNLLVRGPANWVKDAIAPLEGLVETDWSPATFTMNWKLTRPGAWVEFDAGEPLCMLVPQRRGDLEAFTPEIRDIASAPADSSSYHAWFDDRSRFLAELGEGDPEAAATSWQKHYFKGRMPDGLTAPAHQLKLHLRRFARATTSAAERRDGSSRA